MKISKTFIGLVAFCIICAVVCLGSNMAEQKPVNDRQLQQEKSLDAKIDRLIERRSKERIDAITHQP